MNKEILRQKYLHLRKQLTLEEIETLSSLITEKLFFYIDLSRIKSVHTFLPIRKQGEVNTFLIIDKLRRDFPKVDIVISKSNFKTFEMESFLLDKDTILEENKWSILEPKEAETYAEEGIDMVLMPLLIFDTRGFRVGYGRGFYDRFLTKCKESTVKIGLSFFEHVEKIEDTNATDIAMDYAISPKKFYQF